MPGLEHSLEGHDLAYLRSVADIWRVELDAPDTRQAAQSLAAQLSALFTEPDLIPLACQPALQALAAAGGRLPWLQFVRSFGELREMGAARLEKERPQRNPVSITEQVWYRGLVGRAFFDTPSGPAEFAYLPDEVLAALPPPTRGHTQLGRPARPEERVDVRAVSDRILDEATSLLAALRTGKPLLEAAALESWQVHVGFHQALLHAAGLVDAAGRVSSNAARSWLEMDRGSALLALAQAWINSDALNELRLLPGLFAEGGWQNKPKATRTQVLALLRSIPAGQWWSLTAFETDIKQHQPDFQRPGGDYDAWYLRDEEGKYLRGFEYWDAVEGALLRYYLTGPLYWLGFVELAGPSPDGEPLAFRWSPWADDLFNQREPKLPAESIKLKVDSAGQITAARLTLRAVRYQAARFCSWLPPRKGNYQYQISAAGLAAARQQGLQASQLLALLQAQVGAGLPPNLPQALRRWQQFGAQVNLASRLVLRVHSAAALKALRASRAARWLGELLGPLAITIKPGASQQVLQALLELGYLGEIEEPQ